LKLNEINNSYLYKNIIFYYIKEKKVYLCDDVLHGDFLPCLLGYRDLDSLRRGNCDGLSWDGLSNSFKDINLFFMYWRSKRGFKYMSEINF